MGESIILSRLSSSSEVKGLTKLSSTSSGVDKLRGRFSFFILTPE
jgi:hypothetical protein